ncbi:MAG TPA: LLM class flavin-dependent oxidoreductase [Stellaceae bacterium]|jgi:probable F420-dependent oxidoreductase|nr:LLM class flavin-dependent oxidoreductase [Stellaceae bacterium]
MALKDKIALGVSLPHRSPEPIGVDVVRRVAQRAEALGFRDLWVTENTLDHVFCFDPVAVLTYAAAITTRIRLGASVVVLPIHHPALVAHQWACLDYLSGGRAILGVGLGREHHYAQFQIPREARVRRFREDVELIRALWKEPRVDFRGRIFQLEGGTMMPKPVQKPSLPMWFGVGHPNAVRRAGSLADGWMGSGGSSIAAFKQSVPILLAALEAAGRDPANFPVSKRLFMAVDERPGAARAELNRWFTEVYHNPEGTDASGIHGTPEQVRERLEELVAMGANHLLLNPVSRHVEQVEALAAVAGLT